MEMAGALYLAAEYPLLLSHGLQEVFKVQFHELSVLRLAKNTHQPCIQKANPLHGRGVRVQHISAVYLCAPCVGDLFLQLQWRTQIWTFPYQTPLVMTWPVFASLRDPQLPCERPALCLPEASALNAVACWWFGLL